MLLVVHRFSTFPVENNREGACVAMLGGINRALRGVCRFSTNLLRDRKGVTALEFAIVAPVFLALLLAILYTMLIYLAQQMLETAAQSAGRLMLTGAVQTTQLTNGHVGMTASDFKNAICNGFSGTGANGQAISKPSLLPSMLSCSRLTVNVTTVSAYNVSNTSSPTFTYDSNGVVTSTGTGYNYQTSGAGQNRIVVLQLIYLWPTGKGPLGLDLSNQPNANRKLVATSVFTTENYTCNTSQTSC
jgi:Flp pilus assembly protein TadG